MERKKGLDSIISAMVTMNPKDSKKLKRIVKYLGKITKKYLLHIGHIVNKEWNEGYVDETSGVVHLD